MLDIKELKKKGYSAAALKKLFSQKPEDLKKNNRKLWDLLQSQQNFINDASLRCLDRAREFWAIDQSYDISQKQIPISLVQGLLSKNPGPESVKNIVEYYGKGLDDMIRYKKNSAGQFLDSEGRVCDQSAAVTSLHLPTFFNIYVPLTMSYHKARWAKLYNDRNVKPRYKLEPSIMSRKRMMAARVITSRIDRMDSDMGYGAIERDSIHNALLYGHCFNFATEPWVSEKHTIGGKTVTTKSGVPFTIPHPSRVFYDMTKPLATLNTDTGVDRVGYWTIQRFSDVYANTDYWNRSKIELNGNPGTNWQSSGIFRVYQELYPCAAQFPTGIFRNSNDREEAAWKYTYSNANDKDAAVNVTVLFHKIIPKDYGLYDYDKPVWHRFVFAGNTVVHVVPWTYTPACVYQYDADGNRAKPSGIGLELMPYQDHMSNLLTQYLLSVKKNLIRIVATDLDIIKKDDLDRIRNEPENSYRGIEFMSYDSRELANQGVDVLQGFKPIQFQAQNTQEILAAITALLSMVERALGFSPQEVGASASHQQSAREIITINSNTSQRLQLTGSYIDEGMAARAKMLYYAMLGHDSDEVLAEVSDLNEIGREELKKMGFEIDDDGDHTVGVRGPKSALLLEGIGMFQDPTQRINEPQVAALLTQFFDRILTNPAIVDKVGVKFVFDRFNEIGDWLQLPVDFRLPTDFKDQQEPSPEQQQAQLQAFQQVAAQVAQEVVGQAVQGLSEQLRTQLAEPIAQKTQQLEQALMQLMQQSQATQQGLEQVGQQVAVTQQGLAEVGKATMNNSAQIEQLVRIIGGMDTMVSALTTPPAQPEMAAPAMIPVA